MPYLSASKIFLQSKKRFWVNEGQSGFATTDLPISQVWDVTYKQPGTRGILQAFPISLHSRRVTGMSEQERINFALEQVEMIYPGMREHFEGGATKCWDEDEWARGASPITSRANSAHCCRMLRGPKAEFISPASTPQCGSTAGCRGRSNRATAWREK